MLCALCCVILYYPASPLQEIIRVIGYSDLIYLYKVILELVKQYLFIVIIFEK